MAGKRWSYVVHDARGRRHRGSVTWCTPGRYPERPARAAFLIVLVDRPAEAPQPETRTAFCLPAAAPLHILGQDEAAVVLPADIAELELPVSRMAAFGAGSIVMEADIVTPPDIFPAHSRRPRLDRLALAVIEAAEAHIVAPYAGLVRHVLELRGAADPIAALEARLGAPGLPPRAPGLKRLRAATRALRRGRAPDTTLEEMSEDLRFLLLFDEPGKKLERDALGRLLDDVLGERSPRTRTSAPTLPIRRPPEDA